MDDLVKAVDSLGNAMVVLAQAVEQMGMISEQTASRFNGYYAAFEEHMGGIEGSARKEADDG